MGSAAEALDPGNPQAGVTTIEEETYHCRRRRRSRSGRVTAGVVAGRDADRLVKSIPDDGNTPQPLVHTAIFVYDLRDGRSFQLTQPPDALVRRGSRDAARCSGTRGRLVAGLEP